MVFFGAGCYDAIETIKGVIEKLSNHCYANNKRKDEKNERKTWCC